MGKGEKQKRVFIVESFRGTCIRIRIRSTLKSYDRGDMVGLNIFQGSDQSLSKKWTRTRANGPTKAGQVRKRTRKKARKRAKVGQEVNLGEPSTEPYKEGHESARRSDYKCDI